jgi:hypothetical protein
MSCRQQVLSSSQANEQPKNEASQTHVLWSMKSQRHSPNICLDLSKYGIFDDDPIFKECAEYKKFGSCKHLKHSISRKYGLMAETK